MSAVIRVEPDVVRGRSLAVAIAASVAATAACIAIAWLALRLGESAVGASVPPPVEAPRQIQHGLIDEERPGPRERAAARASLAEWSWVDRERGVVTVPIERAIETVVSRDEHDRENGRP